MLLSELERGGVTRYSGLFRQLVMIHAWIRLAKDKHLPMILTDRARVLADRMSCQLTTILCYRIPVALLILILT